MKSRLHRIQPVHILEALWISAILIIPTACVSRYFIISELDNSNTHVPKVALLRTIAAGMLIIYLYQLRNIDLRGHLPTTVKNVISQLKHSPQAWVFTSVGLVAISTIVTTTLSTNPSVSMWGLVPGLSGYSAYTSLCYMVVFVVIATNLRSLEQLRRLILSIVGMGVIVSSIGFFQHFNIDIFQLQADDNFSRATLTTGNAVFAGSLLLIPILITLGVSSAHLYTLSINQGLKKKFIITILLWSVILSVQLSAQLFTLSRGPIIATISSIILLIVSLLIFRRFHLAVITTSTIMISIIMTISISYIPVEYDSMLLRSGIELEINPIRIEDRIADTKTQIVSGGLNQRVSIWSSSAELITTRPWFDSMDLTLQTIRPLIGYGPDTFQYVFNLASTPSIDGRSIEASHAHNYFIHQAVTEGILGLISSIGLLASPIVMSGLFLIFRKNNTDLQILCLTGIFAMFSGRLAEQLLGLATTSDLTVFWVCLAASVATIKIFSQNTLSATRTENSKDNIGKTTRSQTLQIFIIVLASLSILVFTISHAIKYPVAGALAGQSRSLYESGKLEESLSRIDTAIWMTPKVQYYYYLKNRLLKEFLDHPEKVLHNNCNKEANHIIDDKAYSLCLAQDMYSTANISRQIQPFSYQSVYQVAIISKMFGQDKKSLQAYETLAKLMPRNRPILHMLSKEYISREMFKNAEHTLEQSLNISKLHSNSKNNDFFTNEAMQLLHEIK